MTTTASLVTTSALKNEYKHSALGYCQVFYQLSSSNNLSTSRGFVLFTFVPVCLTIIFYSRILVIANCQRDIASNLTLQQRRSRVQNVDNKALKTLFIITASTAITLLPLYLYTYWKYFDTNAKPNLYVELSVYAIDLCSNWIPVNLLIYTIRDKSFIKSAKISFSSLFVPRVKFSI